MAKKATILIVDKEKMLVDLLIRTLSSPELPVVGTTSADEAARLNDLHAPDLIVVDPTLPSGLPFMASVHSGHPKTKMIALSSVPEMRNRAQAAGAKITLDRDAGLDALVAAIRAQLPQELHVFGQDDRTRVLLCDDEEDLRDLLSEFLTGRGYAVTMAKNGKEAVEKVHSQPDLQIVLLDVSMPVMGGIEALNQIMALEPHPCVIMMTAVADREIARHAMKTGAFDYILKPFDFSAIESTIAACLSYVEYQKQPWWKRLTRG